jgi:nucleoside-diphosphate-sugar epimerase
MLFTIRAARSSGCRRVVYASSSGVVGCSIDPKYVANDRSPYCDDVVRDWPYYSGKVEAERRALSYAADNGLELICMRPSMMWGPGDNRFRSTKLVLCVCLICSSL